MAWPTAAMKAALSKPPGWAWFILSTCDAPAWAAASLLGGTAAARASVTLLLAGG